MERKQSLREFQSRLADKLKAAQTATGTSSKLGFIAGGAHWLVSLDQVNEVVTVPELTAVPWSQPWFVGVASVRGALYGCTDLAAFMKLAEPLARGEARLLLAHPRFGINAALRIERALDLRGAAELKREAPGQDAAPWIVARWHGADGRVWTEISMERLVKDASFLEAGLDL